MALLLRAVGFPRALNFEKFLRWKGQENMQVLQVLAVVSVVSVTLSPLMPGPQPGPNNASRRKTTTCQAFIDHGSSHLHERAGAAVRGPCRWSEGAQSSTRLRGAALFETPFGGDPWKTGKKRGHDREALIGREALLGDPRDWGEVWSPKIPIWSIVVLKAEVVKKDRSWKRWVKTSPLRKDLGVCGSFAKERKKES